MKEYPINSSLIKRIFYDVETLTLRIQFKGGKKFDYLNVENDKFEELMNSDSIGSFYLKNIKYNYKNLEVEL